MGRTVKFGQPGTPQNRRITKLILAIAALLLLTAALFTAVSIYQGRSELAFPGNPVTIPEGDVEPAPGITVEPFWPEPPYIPRPRHVKGIFVRGNVVSDGRLPILLELVQSTELNSMVIDLKEDNGRLTYPRTQVPWAEEAGAPGQHIEDPVALVTLLSDHGVYPIAYIAAFKDNTMAQHRPDLAVQRSGGGLWRDSGGYYWLDPYNKENWKYVVALAREAAELGFREIQFDYIRFPSDGNLRDIIYPAQDDTPFNEVIPAFLRYAGASLEEYDVEVSADVFGVVTSEPGGAGIGQQLELMASEVDLLCPMIYPSHYGAGYFGLSNPNAAPYETVYHALSGGKRRLEKVGLNTNLRPWVQAFSWGHPYGAAEIRAQIQAAEDLGIYEFLLWNSGSYYNSAALRSPDKE